MSTDSVKSVVIGAGVIGCAVAKELSQMGLEPLLLESGPRIAEGVTSRNSGVIHAGIYYPPQSLKAKLCIEGKNLLYEWVSKHEVGYKKCGKWIVASKEEEADLQGIFENAQASGATGLAMKTFDGEKLGLPQIRAQIGIWSEETGIIDPFELSKSFLTEAENQGALLLTDCKVSGISQQPNKNFLLSTTRGPIEAELVINCAGLFSDEIAGLVGVHDHTIFAWRGDYFKLSPRYRLSTLIYPVKKKGAPGLGVHLTVNMDGSNKLGPDVEFSGEKEDFSPRPEKRAAFLEAASKYLNGLTEGDLSYDMVGIRPKLRSPADKVDGDFVVHKSHNNFIHFIGIESPGLTASLALAKRLRELL